MRRRIWIDVGTISVGGADRNRPNEVTLSVEQAEKFRELEMFVLFERLRRAATHMPSGS